MIEIDNLPEGMREKVKEDIQKYGEWHVSHMLYCAPLGRILTDLQASNTDFCWHQATRHLIEYYAEKDPTPMHFVIAREILKEAKVEENDKKAVDILARELVTYCNKFKEKAIQEKVLDTKFSLKDEGGWLIPATNEQSDLKYESNDLNSLDKCFIDFIFDIGKEGEKKSEQLLENSKERYKSYKENEYSKDDRPFAWSLWISPERSILSPYLSVLCHVLWQDVCKKRWEREVRQVPALTQGVLVITIKPSLSKETRVEVLDNSIKYISEQGTVIATVPCIDPTLLPIIRRGIECFSSLTGHKLLRWEVRTGFENWARREIDHRLINSMGGYEAIANLIGCGNSKKSPTEVKSILYAQAHGYFQDPRGGSGNMIILRETNKLRNGEPTGINIILGEMLLPNFTHLLPHGEKKRLVPITELPPLIGSKNTHAAQAMLQLLILEEFSRQSDVLAKRRSIRLPQQKWEELSHAASLPKSCLNRVIAGWTEDDTTSKAFLEKQGDEYTLGSSYAQVIDFLEHQGVQRETGSQGGIKSSEAKKEHQKRRYTKKINPP